MTHDYRRNGTTDLFAALNVATGEVIAQCRTRHAGADVLAFFKLINKQVVNGRAQHALGWWTVTKDDGRAELTSREPDQS